MVPWCRAWGNDWIRLLLITRSAVRARPGEPFQILSLCPPSPGIRGDHKTVGHRVGVNAIAPPDEKQGHALATFGAFSLVHSY